MTFVEDSFTVFIEQSIHPASQYSIETNSLIIGDNWNGGDAEDNWNEGGFGDEGGYREEMTGGYAQGSAPGNDGGCRK